MESRSAATSHRPYPQSIERARHDTQCRRFCGLSFRYANAKMMGYRADFFFGAMDGGIDTGKSGNIGFYGPFAAISVGLGG